MGSSELTYPIAQVRACAYSGAGGGVISGDPREGRVGVRT